MNYKYRVTLSGIKGFFRLYTINEDSSLYTFSKQLQSDLEFASDQQILFKALNEDGDVVARYALVDLGAGTADSVKIGQTIKAGAVQFVYFYDIVSKKSVIITLEGESAEETQTPVLLESKGPNPIEFEHGYVAFEDLPDEKRRLPGEKSDDDEDEDFEDEEDDDESDEDEDESEEDIIYDENE